MVRIKNLVEHGHAVQDLIHCGQCGNRMQFNRNEFSCPRNENAIHGGCRTQPTNVDTLLRKVIDCLIGRLMNESVTQELANAARVEVSRILNMPARQIEVGPRFRWIRIPNQRTDEPFAQGHQMARVPSVEELKNTIQEPQTYLDYATPADTRELLSIFVKEIRVGPHSVELVYKNPMPDEENRPSVTSDQVPL